MLSSKELQDILLDIIEIKEDIITMIYNARSGHPGGSLSCASIIYLLYKKIMNFDSKNPQDPNRDFFILSKGHAAPALYAVLTKLGMIPREYVHSLRQMGSPLQGHPLKNETLGIEISTGSLGMGLSIGIGTALAANLDGLKRMTYVLLGDGELNEGLIWEAAMAASHYRLDNLMAIIDRNGIQIDGSTEEIMGLEPLSDKWKSFGWNVVEVDGSDLNAFYTAVMNARKVRTKPSVIISYMIKGSDVTFMEHTKKYHGRAPNDEEYQLALKEFTRMKNNILEEFSDDN